MSVIINDPPMCVVVKAILEELLITDARRYPMDHLRRTALVAEEAGEALRAALNATRHSHYFGPDQTTPKRRYYDDTYLYELRTELVQTATMAIKQLCEMEREVTRA